MCYFVLPGVIYLINAIEMELLKLPHVDYVHSRRMYTVLLFIIHLVVMIYGYTRFD